MSPNSSLPSPKLPSPSHAVVGCSSLGASVEFLRLFGFGEPTTSTLPAEAARALYGLESSTEEAILKVPGASLGYVRLAGTPNPKRSFDNLDNRPFAIDLFTTDLDRSLALAGQNGFHSSPVATHQFGPISIREVEIKGPDDLIVTLLESAARRPTILDSEPDRLHSEIHALVWSVKEIDKLLPFWIEQVGLETLTDAVFDSPEMGAVLGVPDRRIKARLAVFADSEAQPIRLELIEFLGEPAADHPNFPLAAGLYAPAFELAFEVPFEVDSLEAVCEQLEGAELSDIIELDTPIHPRARAVTGVAPGGLRFEIWTKA